MHQNLPGLMDMDQDERVVWPRDSLFRYFELLEKLQYNLEERKQLQEFAGMLWMLGVKFIRAAHITGENRVCSLLWHLSLCISTSHLKKANSAFGMSLSGHVS